VVHIPGINHRRPFYSFLALFGLFFSILPFIGVIICAIVLWRTEGGVTKKIAKFGFYLGVISTVLWISILLFNVIF
jgi:hypothetical protein